MMECHYIKVWGLLLKTMRWNCLFESKLYSLL
jgi:hypothetical protein